MITSAKYISNRRKVFEKTLKQADRVHANLVCSLYELGRAKMSKKDRGEVQRCLYAAMAAVNDIRYPENDHLNRRDELEQAAMESILENPE